MMLEIDVSKLNDKEKSFYRVSPNDLIIEALKQGYNVVTSYNYAKNSRIDKDSYTKELEETNIKLEEQLSEKLNRLNEFTKEINILVSDRVENELKGKNELIEQLKSQIYDKDEMISEKNEMKENLREKNKDLLDESKLLRDEINNLKLGTNNSAIKGDIGEKYINDILKEELKDSCEILEPGINKTGNVADTHIVPKKYIKEEGNSPILLLETKNYSENSKNHLKKEIEKFYRDIDNIKSKEIPIIAGIFISLRCGIPGKESFYIEEYNNLRVYFISNFSDIESKILIQIINIEIDIYNNNKDKDKELLLYSFIDRYIKIVKKFKNLDPCYDRIKETINKIEKEYNRLRRPILNEIDILQKILTLSLPVIGDDVEG